MRRAGSISSPPAPGRPGLTRTGPVQARCRPYSGVARVPVRDGNARFKASPPASGFEPALIAALADWYPDQFTAPAAPFDWGDAAVAHPFASLLVALRTAAEHAGLPPRSPQLAVLTEEYLKPWLDAGHQRAAVDRSLTRAFPIAPRARALAGGRVFRSRQLDSGTSTSQRLAAASVRFQAWSRLASLTPSTWSKRAIGLRTGRGSVGPGPLRLPGLDDVLARRFLLLFGRRDASFPLVVRYGGRLAGPAGSIRTAGSPDGCRPPVVAVK